MEISGNCNTPLKRQLSSPKTTPWRTLICNYRPNRKKREISDMNYTLEEMEREMIKSAIAKYDGNLSAVASQLGITRQTLYNKMRKFGL